MVNSESKFKMRHTLLLFAISLSFGLPALAQEQVVPAQPSQMVPPPIPSDIQQSSGSGENSSTGTGYTIDEDLIYRINFGRTDDVKFLLDKGANPNARTKQGDPVLSVAIDRDDSEAVGMVKALLDKGADPNTPDRSKNYPIVSATRNGQPGMVAALIDKGADFQQKSSSGTPLIDLAKINGNQDLIKLIQDQIDKENAFARDLRTEKRYKEILADYAYDNCLYQYWQYFITAQQDKNRLDEANKKMATNKNAINHLVKQIQRYYPFTSTSSLRRIASVAINGIFDQLDQMISNSNRNEHGVGQNGDDERRCRKIVDAIDINLPAPPGFFTATGK